MKPKYKFVGDGVQNPDGSHTKILTDIVILHEGWDTADTGWILEDGQVITTAEYHCIVPMAIADIDDKIAEAEESLKGLRLARAALKGRTD